MTISTILFLTAALSLSFLPGLYGNSIEASSLRRETDLWKKIEQLENDVKILKQDYSSTATILRSFLDQPNVTFYSEKGQQGNHENIQFTHEISCYNLRRLAGQSKSFEFNQASSCVRIYTVANCLGSSTWLVPPGLLHSGSQNQDGDDQNLFDAVSVSPCFPTMYSPGYFNWLLHRARGMMTNSPIATRRTAFSPSCTSQQCHYHFLNGCVCEDGCSGIFDYATFTCRVVRSSTSHGGNDHDHDWLSVTSMQEEPSRR